MWGWLSKARAWSDRSEANHRGQPAPYSPFDMRRHEPLVEPAPDGFMHRGAFAQDFSPGQGRRKFVVAYLPLNPIGAGTFYMNQLPIHQDGRFDPNTGQYFTDFGQYLPGLGVVWGAAGVNYGRQPSRLQPIYTPEL